jgi:hypothetical protein
VFQDSLPEAHLPVSYYYDTIPVAHRQYGCPMKHLPAPVYQQLPISLQPGGQKLIAGNLSLSPGMGTVINRREMIQVHVRVSLGRGEADMTEQFLDNPQVSTAI